MKISSLSKLVGAGVIAASLAVVPLTLPAQAQTDGTGTSNQPNGDVQSTENDNDFDWGWLGLLGLAGLAGLAGKKRHETVHTQQVHHDPDVVVRRGSDLR